MSCIQTVDAQQALADRLMQAATHALELNGVYLGVRLGLYTTLARSGALTAQQLADDAGIASRYAREWLEQQAVAGFIAVDNPGASAEARRYRLPTEHTGVLADETHPAHLAPIALMIASIGRVLPDLVEAYRTGTGLPFEAYGPDMRHGQAGVNRPLFLHDLVDRWLPGIPELHDRLTRPGTRVADVGCGVGWSTLAIARAYRESEVVGYDLDAASIEDARRHAAEAGIRVRFERKDASGLAGDGPFDVAIVLEALHDMARPTEALRAIRAALTPDGVVLVADEKVAEHFSAPGDELERLMYGWSITHCLPASLADVPSEAIGTAIRPHTVIECATAAGFGQVDVLPVESSLFRFYRLAM